MAVTRYRGAAVAQVLQDRVKLRMKSILTGPKVHRPNRHIFANAPNVLERQTIDPTGIAIAMSTGEIAIVSEPKPD